MHTGQGGIASSALSLFCPNVRCADSVIRFGISDPDRHHNTNRNVRWWLPSCQQPPTSSAGVYELVSAQAPVQIGQPIPLVALNKPSQGPRRRDKNLWTVYFLGPSADGIIALFAQLGVEEAGEDEKVGSFARKGSVDGVDDLIVQPLLGCKRSKVMVGYDDVAQP